MHEVCAALPQNLNFAISPNPIFLTMMYRYSVLKSQNFPIFYGFSRFSFETGTVPIHPKIYEDRLDAGLPPGALQERSARHSQLARGPRRGHHRLPEVQAAA